MRRLLQDPLQLGVFLGVSAAALLLAGLVQSSQRQSFQKYFGSIPPLLVMALAALTGLALFAYLLPHSPFSIFRGDFKGILLAAALTLPFAVVIILVDRAAPFPADINVPLPGALAFYPSIAFVVEIVFHLLPFTLLYAGLSALTGSSGDARVVWASLLITALLEPIFQVIFTTGQNNGWVMAYLGLHLFLFNLVQLLLFTRYDFLSMITFRWVYYLLWHVLWGYLRLGLLFP